MMPKGAAREAPIRSRKRGRVANETQRITAMRARVATLLSSPVALALMAPETAAEVSPTAVLPPSRPAEIG